MTQLEPKWEEYFVFTIVRNPWLRGLSAYTMFTGNFLRKYAHAARLAQRDQQPWPAPCMYT